MLNFDNSVARQRLDRNYSGVVDFGMGEFDAASYLYPKQHKDYTIGGETDYGDLKIYDSDKYNIKTPDFKSAYHMAEFVDSPLPDIPTTTELQFTGADTNEFLSVPKNDLVLENYVGQEQQAEGISTEEEFFVSQARKEVTDSGLNPVEKFMRSPEIEDLITYKSPSGGKVYTEQERQHTHKAARGKNNPLPLGKTDSKGKPLGEEEKDSSETPDKVNVAPAFPASASQGGGGGAAASASQGGMLGTVFHQPSNLSKEETKALQERIKRIEKVGKEVRHTRTYKKELASLRGKSQLKTTENIMMTNAEADQRHTELQRINGDKLKELQQKQAITKEKIKKLEDGRLGKKNSKQSQKKEESKSEKEESKSEKEESKSGREESKSGKGESKSGKEGGKSEKEDNQIMSLGNAFSTQEKTEFQEFLENHGINMRLGWDKLRHRLSDYLKRTGRKTIDGRKSEYKDKTSWLKQFLYQIKYNPVPEVEEIDFIPEYAYGTPLKQPTTPATVKKKVKALNENRNLRTTNFVSYDSDDNPEFLNLLPLGSSSKQSRKKI